MQWYKYTLAESTDINLSSIAHGNGYYAAAGVKHSGNIYTLEIFYSADPSKGWTAATIKNFGADVPSIGDICHTGTHFVIPYTTNLNHALSVLYTDLPTNNWTDNQDIFTYGDQITINASRFVGDKLVVCGTDASGGWIFYADTPDGTWYEYCVLATASSVVGNCIDIAFNTATKSFAVYTLAKLNTNTNEHRIYTSGDLATWSSPRTIASDTLSSPVYPTLCYCNDYNAFSLFLHGNIYIIEASKVTELGYPKNIDEESVRAAASDGTKFLASAASDTQDLTVIYSSGDPTVADNWHVNTLEDTRQVSPSVVFSYNTEMFCVLAGTGGTTKPSVFMAKYAANEFKRMKDRVPTYPGRVTLTPTGATNTYTLERADEPTEEGTKLSKVNLLSDDATMAVWNNTAPSVECTPSTAFEHIGKNSFHVGDILTTVRDLSGDEDWLKCDGSEIDAMKYPALADLFGGAVIPAEWEKGGIITERSKPRTDGKSDYTSVLVDVCKSASYYGVFCQNQIARTGYSGWYSFFVLYTTDKMSNNWNRTSVASWYGGDDGTPVPDDTWMIFPSGMFYVNDTWICVGAAQQYRSGQQYPMPYSRIWYCKGDVPSSFTQAGSGLAYYTLQYIVYGNGYYVASANYYANGPTYPAIIYGTDIANMQSSKQLSSTQTSATRIIFANNTFAVLHAHDNKLDVIYCSGIPSDNWTTVTAVASSTPVLSFRMEYVAPYWMIFYVDDSKKPSICYTDDLSGKWTTVKAPWDDGKSSYTIHRTAASDNLVMLLGKKNETFYTWYGSSPVGSWKEIPISTELQNPVPWHISYSGGEWFMPQESGNNIYLAYRSDNSAPNLPFLNPGRNMTTYIKAREGD